LDPARLERISDAGGICISFSAYDYIQGKIGVEFTDLGDQNLKNIARPIRAHAIGLSANAHQPDRVRSLSAGASGGTVLRQTRDSACARFA